MQREYTLHAYAVGNTANREGLAYTGTLAGNNCAFELLNSFTLTLADVYVDRMVSPTLNSGACSLTESAAISF